MRPQLAEHPRALAHPIAQEARHRQLGVQDRARHLAEERERGVVPITERFGMVFVIQNTQSRDTQAMQLKLDELTRVNKMTRNSLINLEEMSQIDVERMKTAFATLAAIETATNS